MTNPYGQHPQYPASNSGGFPQQQYPGYQPMAGQPPAQQQFYFGYPTGSPPPGNNGLAIASMVVSLVSIPFICFWPVGLILAILGVVFGHIALNSIKRDGTGGRNMAIAGLVIGYCFLGFIALLIMLVFAVGFSAPFLASL